MCSKLADAFARVFLVGGPSQSYGGLDRCVDSRHSSASIWDRRSLRRTGASSPIHLVNMDLRFAGLFHALPISDQNESLDLKGR
jgi:hypothetical protein